MAAPKWGKKGGTSNSTLTFDWGDTFKPACDLKPVNGLKIGVYATAKVGKSTLALSAPLPIIAIDTEAALRLNSRSYPEERYSQIHINEVINTNDGGSFTVKQSLGMMEKAIRNITQMILLAELPEDQINEEIKAWLDTLPFDPRTTKGTIVVDSASDMWDWLKIWLETEGATVFNADGSMNRMEWGKPNKKYLEFMTLLLRSHWNVVFTYRAFNRISSKGADLDIKDPSWQKKTDYQLDLFAELVDAGTCRRLVFKGGRLPGMDTLPDLDNPTWDKLVEHIKKYSGIDIT